MDFFAEAPRGAARREQRARGFDVILARRRARLAEQVLDDGAHHGIAHDVSVEELTDHARDADDAALDARGLRLCSNRSATALKPWRATTHASKSSCNAPKSIFLNVVVFADDAVSSSPSASTAYAGTAALSFAANSRARRVSLVGARAIDEHGHQRLPHAHVAQRALAQLRHHLIHLIRRNLIQNRFDDAFGLIRERSALGATALADFSLAPSPSPPSSPPPASDPLHRRPHLFTLDSSAGFAFV